jgi:hypothetical protein
MSEVSQEEFEKGKQCCPEHTHETVGELLDWLKGQPLSSILVIAKRGDERGLLHIASVNCTTDFEGEVAAGFITFMDSRGMGLPPKPSPGISTRRARHARSRL